MEGPNQSLPDWDLAALVHGAVTDLVAESLLWLRGLGVLPQTEGLLVRFPVRAQGGVAGSAPVGAHPKGSPSTFLSRTDVFLPLFLPPFPSF